MDYEEKFKACVYEAFHNNEHWEQFLECVVELYLQAAPRWISVEDELPKKDGKYLFYDEILGVQASIYYDGCSLINSITHWMPLPLPPAKLSSLERIGKNWKGGEQ